MELIINDYTKNKLKDVVIAFNFNDGKYIGDNQVIWQIAMHYKIKTHHILMDFRCVSKANKTMQDLRDVDNEIISICNFLVEKEKSDDMYLLIRRLMEDNI